MLQFSSSQPFPYVSAAESLRADAKSHAQAVDNWLGLRTQQIESGLAEKGCRNPPPSSSGQHQELWFGLDVQDLLTPYIELRCLLEFLRPRHGQKIVDLGAAYGRMAFVIARHFPGVQFTGYEYVGERVTEGRLAFKRAGILDSCLEHVDLSAREFSPQRADFYFIYDYGTMKSVDKTLYDLKRMTEVQLGKAPPIIVARGRHCRSLIQSRHLWLEGVFELGRTTFYRKANMELSAQI